MSDHRVKILDPGKEEERIWQAKRADLDPRRMRSVAVLLCEICNRPIGPDELIVEVLQARSCVECAKKTANALKQAEALGIGN